MHITPKGLYGNISLQDKQIGRLLDFIEGKGLRENTIIVYVADHGDMMGEKLEYDVDGKERIQNA